MNAAEEGVLLLCCRLGDEASRPLSMAQFRDLGLMVRASVPNGDPLCDLTEQMLLHMGCSEEHARRIIGLLDRKSRLQDYLGAAEQRHIYPITRVSAAYPQRISQKRRLSCPPVLFACGDAKLLQQPSVAVVGSRQLLPENESFARAAGRAAANASMTVVSGNAVGADQTAQNSCLDSGGTCVVFTADRLMNHHPHPQVLYLSEDGYDLPFSPARALHRNGLIHMQGDKVIAAQCTYGKGGTWEGCTENLRHGWSPLFVFDDGSPAMDALIQRGATGVRHITSISDLLPSQLSLFQ